MWYIHTLEYQSALKRNEILAHATSWIKLENRLSESSQMQKDRHCVIAPIGSTRSGQIRRDGKWRGGCRRQREQDWEAGVE